MLAMATAKAADLAQKPLLKAPPAAPMPAFSWTGCYAGLNGGGGWSRQAVDARSSGALIGTSDVHSRSAIFGGQVGCDQQFGKWVIGLEGQLDGANFTGQGAATFFPGTAGQFVNTDTRWLGSVTGRLGFAGLDPRALVYVKGGAAWAGEKYFVNTTVAGLNGSYSQVPAGWTAGGGVAWALDQHWSIFAEYDHYDFSHRSFDISSLPDAVSIHGPRLDTLQVGVNYRFLGH